jgi:hypothetical protein
VKQLILVVNHFATLWTLLFAGGQLLHDKVDHLALNSLFNWYDLWKG